MPGEPYTPNFDNDEYAEAFNEVFGNHYPSKYSQLITKDRFKHGLCLFVFRIEPTGGDIFENKRTGYSRVSVRFQSPLTESVTMICYVRRQPFLKLIRSELS